MQRKTIVGILTLGLLAISATVDLTNLFNYANQDYPAYFESTNEWHKNRMDDARSTLGRVLFYDKQLSVDNTISCASCHHQQFAFGDTAQLSEGVNGLTTRHSMRLINPLFNNEGAAFWDKRAISFEDQALQPIRDFVEMGFSDSLGQPGLDSLVRKLEQSNYYSPLFALAFGDSGITEERIELSLANFVRSIMSYDSRYDAGRLQASNLDGPYPNFSAQENRGMALFNTPTVLDSNGVRVGGGAGCVTCHRAPEFDIRAGYFNNGVIEAADGSMDITNYRSPTLRDLFNAQGELHGPLMHNGLFATMDEVLDHYNAIPDQTGNPDLSMRLQENGHPQQLLLSAEDKADIIAFLKTLTGTAVYADERWSDPFEGGSLELILNQANIGPEPLSIQLFPNPVAHTLHVNNWSAHQGKTWLITDLAGRVFHQGPVQPEVQVSHWPAGIYLLRLDNSTYRFIKS